MKLKQVFENTKFSWKKCIYIIYLTVWLPLVDHRCTYKILRIQDRPVQPQSLCLLQSLLHYLYTFNHCCGFKYLWNIALLQWTLFSCCLRPISQKCSAWHQAHHDDNGFLIDISSIENFVVFTEYLKVLFIIILLSCNGDWALGWQ